jgi:peroxiredoxin
VRVRRVRRLRHKFVRQADAGTCTQTELRKHQGLVLPFACSTPDRCASRAHDLRAQHEERPQSTADVMGMALEKMVSFEGSADA